MKKMLIASMAIIATLLVGCATAPVTTGGSLYESSGKKVSAEVTSYNILSFITPMTMEKVEEATSDLISKCNKKNVINVTSQKKTMFLWLVSIETLTISGYCAK